ncbi:hypothetical protein K502DRAFT_368294 [Neoconidiobolus thromboides FSU 785]|nr:hypothetical protein K502DRAFT_368294 [Neoconidiobolus thromboides FSU 785]
MLVQNLTNFNLKQVVRYLREKDKYNLLLTCREWYQSFLPIIVEIKVYDEYTDVRSNVKMLKYHKYIKHVIIYNFLNFDFNVINYPNLTKITINALEYIKRFNQLSHLELTGLIYGKHELKDIKSNLITNSKKGGVFDIDLELFHRKLGGIKYLSVTKPCKRFFDLLLPHISNNVKSLVLYSNSKSPQLHNTILNKMKNVIQLKLTINEANFKDLKYVETIQLYHLRQLHIDGLCLYKINTLKINFDYMPNLQELILSQMDNVEFTGVSNLRYLELNRTKLKCAFIKNKQFPKLIGVLLNHYYCYSFRLLYSIFNLSNLTCLTLHSHSIVVLDYLLLSEVYPNKRNNLVKISLDGFNISYAFIQFLQKSCKKLQQLVISHCYFNAISSIPCLLPKPNMDSFNNDYYLNQLEQIQINNFYSYQDDDEYNLSKFSEAILVLAPNLKYYNYYIHLPKLKNYKAILKFYTISHSCQYYIHRYYN